MDCVPPRPPGPLHRSTPARGRNQFSYQLTVLVALLTALIACSLHAGEIADAVKQARISGGIIVLVNGSDAIYDEAAATKCTVHGIETDSQRIGALRKRLQASGRYGKISVSGFNGKTLPHIDNLVNLIVIECGGVCKAEGMRVLAPRGIALIKHAGSWTKAVKPVPGDIDEWNQYDQPRSFGFNDAPQSEDNPAFVLV